MAVVVVGMLMSCYATGVGVRSHVDVYRCRTFVKQHSLKNIWQLEIKTRWFSEIDEWLRVGLGVMRSHIPI